MLSPSSRERLAAGLPVLREPGFWAILLVGVALLGSLMGVLLALAIKYHDTFLRLRPLLCGEGLANRQFFAVALGLPLSVLFTVLAVGDLWEQLEDRRQGRPVEWGAFWVFVALAVGLGALVLLALGC